MIPDHVEVAIIEVGRRLDRQGLVPATAGNFSIRLDARTLAVTVSGRHKGFLRPGDVMVVDIDGRPLTAGKRSSAETLLHCGIYRRFPEAGAVLHGHSIANTVMSRAAEGESITLAGYELLKAFPGLPTHEAEIAVPVVENDQDIPRMQQGLDLLWDGMAEPPPGYLIRGHGSYVWAADMPGALARLEALEFMLACEMQERRMR
ncbi:methylthioribulose 1-phosphate dehydratase [Falsiroseomonas stagni]|uniref:Methylthioribulose-1-phosphate dehydratase n=1 Tax=Falsiroseomonas stagni DSM 19981 TaxID=1123062 RepID=A0A1I3Y1D8_9PROT|nr:methylthioribulose 1-phosphate dehydratase [Falsiroseomonas stagni]SFK25648.1 methylthioribulose-1-phosphate dehydratase [Falsiroseomonas stagni DSM 19981]